VSVPEAAVHQHNRSMTRKHYVGATW